MNETNVEIRKAARLIVFDSDGRLLLFRHADGHGREFWATPGGGLEPGETVEQAARREAKEELGVSEIQLAELWRGHSNFPFADRQVSQDETFFLVEHHGCLFSAATDTVHQRECIIDIRWWTIEELESSNDVRRQVDAALDGQS